MNGLLGPLGLKIHQNVNTELAYIVCELNHTIPVGVKSHITPFSEGVNVCIIEMATPDNNIVCCEFINIT